MYVTARRPGAHNDIAMLGGRRVDWNLELQRFSSRVLIYLALMDDTYPSTTDHQAVRLEYRYRMLHAT